MAKENKIYVIATIAVKGKVTGARITDLGDRSKQFMDVNLSDIFNVYKSKPQMFKNISVENGKLSALGSVFTVIDFDTKKPISEQYIVVANKLGNLGYTLIDYKGNVKKCNIADTMKLAEKCLFANAVVGNGQLVPKAVDFITEEIAIKKDSTIEGIGAGLMMDASKKMVGSYRADALNAVGNQNVFDGLTDKQIQAIQAYYLWYTVEEYEKLSHNRTFKVKESKGVKLDNLRQDYVWYFGGIVDRGFKGNSKCTLGHPIRYEYISLGYSSIKEHDENPASFKNRIIFGETCSSDFFLIPLDEMRKLVKIRKAMSEEIEAITNAKKKQVYENDNSEWLGLWNKVDLIKNLVENKNLMQLTKAFGGKVANTLIMFRDLDIPFPDSLVNMACNGAYGTTEKMVKNNKAKEFWRTILPKESKPIIDWIYSFENSVFMGDIRDYLEYMCCYCLAGEYRYDPLNDTGKRFGPMNKRTRAQRYYLIAPFKRFKLYNFRYKELCEFLGTLAMIKDIYEQLIPEILSVAREICHFRIPDERKSKIAIYITAIGAFGYDSNSRDGILRGNGEIAGLFKDYYNVRMNTLSNLLDRLGDEQLLIDLTNERNYFKGLLDIENQKHRVDTNFKIVYSNNDTLEFKNDTAVFGKYTIDLTKRIDREENREVLTLLGSLKVVDFVYGDKDDKPSAVESESKKEDVSTSNKTKTEDKLKVAFNLVPTGSDRYEDKIVGDMFSRGLTYDKLSYKQANIVERVINHYTGDGTSDNNSLTDEEKSNLDKIIARANVNRDFRVKFDGVSKITYDVLNSIKSRDFMSEKQRKHYIKAVEILKNELSEEESN